MTKTRLLKALLFCPLLFLATAVLAQTKSVSGKITDEKGEIIIGASVQVKGTTTGTVTDQNGVFKLNVPASATTLLVSFIGYTQQEVSIANTSEVKVVLQMENTTLTDVVVVGYGTARKKDLTGSVATLKAKDFNKGIANAPDQLIQGKVAGLMVVNTSGAPGAATTVRIRGVSSVRSGNQPLYVIDGVPLDGRVARPGISANGLGVTPDANPLNFVNAFDIASMDVLKDASATAIYGSRGSNGVIIITTKKGVEGPAKLDFNYSVGASTIMKKLKVLNAGEFRKVLDDYKFTSGDGGGDEDAMKAITRTGITQNFNLGISGGSENARYRASFGLMNQDGIVLKSGLKKYTGNLSGQFKFLESKKLGLDFNLMAAQTIEELAPVTNNAGYRGSLIGQALQWNPTVPLRNADGSLNQLSGNAAVNPLAMSEAWNDQANISYILGSISPYFKITDDLEYRFLFSINRQTGIRRTELKSYITLPEVEGLGQAYYGNSELTTKLFTHTLSYNKQISTAFNLGALVGYEYQDFVFKGVDLGALGFTTDALPYTSILQNALQTNTFISSYVNPQSELQSIFGRVTANLRDKYLLTATMRADGSNKFGKNNRYGYFPSFAAKWNISSEDFMKGGTFFQNLALRLGWGITGNQEFPAGAAQEQYMLAGAGGASQLNVANPDLKWEKSNQLNAGLDFTILDSRITGSVDYFHKKTTDLLFNYTAIVPGPASNLWINMPGDITNKGVEVALRGDIIRKKDLTWSLGVNATFISNELQNYTGPDVLTGAISGQGVSGATVQRFANGHPLNVFYVRKYEGLDKDGLAQYADNGNTMYYMGDPNPKQLLGFTTDLSYKKWYLAINFNGAFGQDIYNNTANTVLPVNNLSSRNIARSLIGNNENLANPITTSSRYLEKGDFVKLTNATISYSLGNIGKTFKNVNISLTGQNLFVITNYSGFDPEVNTDKSINGVNSFGIEYSPYPTARNIILGVSVSL
ncbi:SusC/RagA family TonB-linked outer membrane protein [Chitinophaga sp. YIM B06452]|uniref:SusC/RagA family TonB-linked outer membrane protein n=1 Tax=Chitinophaga sp. YIM B06452 TaxID=3082158 RepID=UPI0031FEBF66